MYNFEVWRNKTLVCVGGGYGDIDSLNNRAVSICKERNATNYVIFKIIDGERMYLKTVEC